MAKKKKGFNPSWFWVVATLMFGGPIGLFFLWAKFQNGDLFAASKSRNRGMRNGGIAMLAGSVFMTLRGSFGFLWNLFFMIGGLSLIFGDQRVHAQYKKYSRYEAVIGKNDTMPITAIASAIGVSYNDACTDLQKMIEEGYFTNRAYLDFGNGLFVSDSRYAPASNQATSNATQKKAAAAPSKPAAKQEAQPESEYVRWLTQIRNANVAIQDEKISSQIDEIEQITANIFELVVERPAKRQEINTFMNYYLPTALKLLDAYGRLERQGVSGQNIDKSKREIAAMVDQLVFAFKRQNDQMFANDALDISSDIAVMETMLAKDGLSGTLPESPFAAAFQKKQA